MSKKTSSTQAKRPGAQKQQAIDARALLRDLRKLQEERAQETKSAEYIVRVAHEEKMAAIDRNVVLSRKVATYHAGLEPLNVLVSMLLNLAGRDDSFQRSLLLALAQGISELWDVKDQQEPRNTEQQRQG